MDDLKDDVKANLEKLEVWLTELKPVLLRLEAVEEEESSGSSSGEEVAASELDEEVLEEEPVLPKPKDFINLY